MSEFGKSEEPREDIFKEKDVMPRRKFLGLGAVATTAALVGFGLWKHRQKLTELEKENDISREKIKISTEEFVKEMNTYLELLESYLERYKRDLEDIRMFLDKAEILYPPQNSTEINIYVEFLQNAKKIKETEKNDFFETREIQKRFFKRVSNTDKWLTNPGNSDTIGFLKKWENKEYLPRKMLIEEQIKSLNEQYQKLDERLERLIIDIQKEIDEARRDLRNKIKNPGNSNWV